MLFSYNYRNDLTYTCNFEFGLKSAIIYFFLYISVVQGKLSYIVNIVDVLIGATDIFEEGSWVHLSSWREITITDWAPCMPDNYLSQHCLLLQSKYEYQLNYFYCDAEACVVCERKVG